MRADSWQTNQYPSDKENEFTNRDQVSNAGSCKDKNENLRVLLRVRPLESGRTSCIQVGPIVSWTNGMRSSKQLRIREEKRAHEFSFDTVCGPESSNLDIWNLSGRRVVDSFLNGISSALFSFGQTGSGKTWTMQGDWQGSVLDGDRPKLEVEGISAMALKHVLQTLHNRYGQDEGKWFCEGSILEVYNDSVCDLLSRSTADLCLREDPYKGVWAEGARTLRLRRGEDVMRLIKVARSRLRFSSTAMNLRSSRSHLVLSVFLYLEEPERSAGQQGEKVYRQSRLTLVDLAGNERVSKSEASGKAFREATYVNRSLLALGAVLSALARRTEHVPYRSSKLTFLLKDAIGADSRICVIGHVNPDAAMCRESINTLNFMTFAQSIRTNPRGGNVKFVSSFQFLREQRPSRSEAGSTCRSSHPGMTMAGRRMEEADLTPRLEQGTSRFFHLWRDVVSWKVKGRLWVSRLASHARNRQLRRLLQQHFDVWKDIINERSLQKAAADLFRHSRVLRSVEEIKRSIDDKAEGQSRASLQEAATASWLPDGPWPSYDQWKFSARKEAASIECSLSPEKLTLKTPVTLQDSREFDIHRAVVQSRWAKLSQLYLLIRMDESSGPSLPSPETRHPLAVTAEEVEAEEGTYQSIKRDASPFSDLCEQSDRSSDEGQGTSATPPPPWAGTVASPEDKHRPEQQQVTSTRSCASHEDKTGSEKLGGAGGRYRDMAESVEGSIIQKDLSLEGDELLVTFDFDKSLRSTPRKPQALPPSSRPDSVQLPRPARPFSACDVGSSWKVEVKDGRWTGSQEVPAGATGDRKGERSKLEASRKSTSVKSGPSYHKSKERAKMLDLAAQIAMSRNPK